MMFAALNPMQRRVRQAGLLRKISIGQAASLIPEKACELTIQISSHPEKLAKLS